MPFENPFQASGNWYRANLHAHTTESDGNLSPPEAAEFYRGAGYQVLAITDHWNVSDLKSDHTDFLILRGAELNGGKSAQSDYHIVGLDLRRPGKLEPRANLAAQDLIEIIRQEGGEAFLAHPYWSGLMASDIIELDGCFAVEVYNATCDLNISRGLSMVHWDDLLTLGRDFGALAVDDGHRASLDHGRGWTMIRAPELSPEALMDALRRGLYYSSTGPELKDLRVAEGRLQVVTSPVESIALVSAPARGSRVFAAASGDLTSAEFRLPEARYARIQATDRRGRMAWSNPVLLESP